MQNNENILEIFQAEINYSYYYNEVSTIVST